MISGSSNNMQINWHLIELRDRNMHNNLAVMSEGFITILGLNVGIYNSVTFQGV